MVNSIKNTVSYSGADIQVIAFRGNSTPAEKFSIEKIKRDIQEIGKRQRDVKAEISRAEFEADRENANVELFNEYNSQITDRPKGGFSNPESGSYQNSRGIRYSAKIPELKDEYSKNEHRIAELKKELSAIERIQSFKLGALHTITYSSFREKFAVRSLGKIQAKSYTRGPRTIAGTLVFNTFQEHELIEFARNNKLRDKNGTIHPNAVMLDQIEPFNLLLLFANEFGAYSSLHLLDVDLASEGQEMSIDQIMTHNTLNFYATDMIPMTSIGNQFNSYSEMLDSILNEEGNISGVSSGRTFKNRIDGLINPFADPEEDEFQRILGQSRGLF